MRERDSLATSTPVLLPRVPGYPVNNSELGLKNVRFNGGCGEEEEEFLCVTVSQRKNVMNGHHLFLFGITGIDLHVQPAELLTHYVLLSSTCLKAIIAVQTFIESEDEGG